MKYILFSAVLVFTVFSCGNRTQVRTIEFEIYNTEQYCGGAAPSDDMMADLQSPKPTNDTLYVYPMPDRNGDGAMLILKDGKGKLTGLSNGAYMAYRFSPEKIKKMEMSPDPKAGCYINYYNSFIFDFEILQETKMVSDTFVVECDPCVEPAE
ncbi:hypothetical protein GYB22_06925 [bacterium]|nr:hypothetical protein [bacterium]